jgi:HdeA/HdeB family
MSLVTCTQYLALPPDRSRIFSAWMSGWFNQKTGYTYVNLEAYARNVENVEAWCAANPGEVYRTLSFPRAAAGPWRSRESFRIKVSRTVAYRRMDRRYS